MAAWLLSLLMFVVPAVGATTEELLQDTLKSAIVAVGVLASALAFFWARRGATQRLQWHAGLAIPALLMAYALGSMAWSHAFLAGVEAIRWFMLALAMGLALNVFTRERLPQLAWGVVAGTVVASVWVLLQFLFAVDWFPQGPHPASTFVNRNFFAEYAVCALPFGAIVFARARRSSAVALLSLALGTIVVAVFMTGARAALVALWLELLVLFPWMAWRCRSWFALRDWPIATRAIAAVVFLGVVAGVGVIPTRDAELAAEGKGVTAVERAFKRTASITPGDSSLSIRKVMWRATARMIAANPVAGVGAGGWEVFVPLYQEQGSQIETDFYVHNEYLQLLAEYGVVGWGVLAGLLAWLARAAWRTWRLHDAEEAAWRATLLGSCGALLVVSNVGFPWHLAATGLLFAVALGALAASDLRLGASPRLAGTVAMRPAWSMAASAAVVAATGLAVHISNQAFAAERNLVRAARLAITISLQPNPNDPRFDAAKQKMLELEREGVRLNPHYRKLAPIAADELARWGDWRDAIWIWDGVLASRPYVVVLLTNVARGYIALGDYTKAAEYIERAMRLQPTAPAVQSAEVLLAARSGQDDRALAAGRLAIAHGGYDYDLLNAVYIVARRHRDFALAEQALRLRVTGWETNRMQGWAVLGDMLDREMHEPAKAAEAYSHSLALASGEQREQIWAHIPPDIRTRIAPALAPAQTSASKG